MPSFETCRVRACDVTMSVRVEGVLRPSAEQTLRAALSAAALRYVIELVAHEGDLVRRGDLIARVVSPHANVRESQERSMLHLLEAQLLDARHAALRMHDAAAQLQVAAAEKRVEQARANVEASRLVLAGVELRSPFDGIIASTYAGDSTSNAYEPVTVARVVQFDPLRVEAALPSGISAPPAGEACEVNAGGVRRSASVRGSAPLATSDGLVVLVVEVPNADRAFAAGQRAEVTLGASKQRVSFVPASAVVPEPGACWVWVEGPRGLEARPVQILSAIDGAEVAVAGVVEGEHVVVDAAAFLRAGGARSDASFGADVSDEGSDED
jgi:RND family efflux transporter MFP subunit